MDTVSSRTGVNVGAVERRVSLIAGTLLALAATRRSWTAAAAAALASALALRGLTGRCALYGGLGIPTVEDRGSVEPSIDACVDRAVEESFPASDPPAFAGGKCD